MASTIKNISILLFFIGLISQAYCKPCSLEDLSVKQSETGIKIQGKPEWSVTVTNNCECGQSQVILNCRGYKTVEPVDPNILTYSGTDYCLINYGKPINKQPVSFKYAWDQAFSMTPNSSKIAC
ncbi:hypothetical protein Lal_00006219 [Lupinus albus]|uniref:Uncharacterized protein n=1 Tax=Lupinus albus TaxID=3870 RepID=A0A6A5MWX1_LUPAL|nr:hypothetical protein Lalb_Chr07g0186901 [Lupinus albus]KAF1875590.1 hypothetical protein Lal_00006219 [Lupinus albus]